MASAMWSITFAFWLFSLTKSLHEDRANDTDFDVIITPPLFQSGRVAQKKKRILRWRHAPMHFYLGVLDLKKILEHLAKSGPEKSYWQER